jgi:DNA-binding MarR family transcriptional regulator
MPIGRSDSNFDLADRVYPPDRNNRYETISKQVVSLSEKIVKLTQESMVLALADRGALAPDEKAVISLKNIIENRKLRKDFFSEEIFFDPAWNILLDLTLARLSNKRVSVSSLCIASCVSTSTALRWINDLVNKGILRKIDDPNDKRRNYVELTEEANDQMIQYLIKCKLL